MADGGGSANLDGSDGDCAACYVNGFEYIGFGGTVFGAVESVPVAGLGFVLIGNLKHVRTMGYNLADGSGILFI